MRTHDPHLDWRPVDVAAGDLVVFDSYTPHHSGPNTTDRPRRALYLTYNAASGGDMRAAIRSACGAGGPRPPSTASRRPTGCTTRSSRSGSTLRSVPPSPQPMWRPNHAGHRAPHPGRQPRW
ncbi:MAG: phytanoyl-CoA dioxygenase family protein [Acidimicrobiia bacterium]|nr:phytanoyl-CoA dioxygenase family protein [Acidimicrobiia bacterium]MDH5290156.1 phytanoyl-CoA dioxygenase family protein [Acidimicrobiia bacterium]